MYTYIYVYIENISIHNMLLVSIRHFYTCIYIYICVYIHLYLCMFTDIYMGAFFFVCLFLHIYIYIDIFIYMRVILLHPCVDKYVYMHVYVCISPGVVKRELVVDIQNLRF